MSVPATQTAPPPSTETPAAINLHAATGADSNANRNANTKADGASSPGSGSKAAPSSHNSSKEAIAPHVEHTLLRADASPEAIDTLCNEAINNNFFAVCVHPSYILRCKQNLQSSQVKVVTVVGFPLGTNTPSAKAFEAREAVRLGADEVDMVINLAALKAGQHQCVSDDMKAVVTAAHPKPVKVILETGTLSHEQKIAACTLAQAAGAHFVKTSTGFGNHGGATIEDVRLMRQTVGSAMGVKASGGIRTHEQAQAMLDAGANRIGASQLAG